MERTLGGKLWVVDPSLPNAGTPGYVARTAKELGFPESWFRDAIAANPDLVIGPCQDADITDEDWFLWSTEVSVTDVGSIDVALLSESGRIGIIETKLSENREGRRNVLAQVLDYAVHLPEMRLDELPIIPVGIPAERHEVEDHLAKGDFLLVVVGDQLDRRAVRLSTALLGEHLINPWDLAMVDLTVYEASGEDNAHKYLVVPALRRALVTERRQVVRITVAEHGRAVVTIERVPPEPDDSGRSSWTEQDFRNYVDSTSHVRLEFKQLALGVLSLLQEFPDLTAFWGSGTAPSLTLKRNRKGLIELHPRWGSVNFRPSKFKDALGPELGRSYEEKLRQLLPGPMSMRYPNAREEQIIPVASEVLSTLREHVAAAEAQAPTDPTAGHGEIPS